MQKSLVNPFKDLRKALDLIRGSISTGVFGFNVLDELHLCERVLTYLLTYESCLSKPYMESPSIKEVFTEDMFENSDLSDMFSFYERISPLQGKDNSTSQ